MITVKCTYSNGQTITTSMNGSLETANSYFVGQWFNLGSIEDNMQQCVKVELVN